MKLSKSKLALAKVINGNGGWPQDSEWSVQNGEHGLISFSVNKPVRHDSKSWMAKGGFNFKIEVCKPLKNWHQCVLSREEYYQAYPKADDDGWIEWKGGECPVDGESIVDVEFNSGNIVSGVAKGLSWRHEWTYSNVIAYRLHKPDVKPEPCESVMRSIPEPESIDGLCAKVTEENKHQHIDAKPTIEQLAQDYRNKLDFANSKQKEADDAKSDADEALRKMELAGEDIGLVVTPITAKQEPEPVIAVQVGDEAECVESNIKRDKYNGMAGRLRTIDESDTSTPYLVDFGGEERIWCHEVKFIRRP